jgi:lipopolysaccharide export system protein LptA
MKWQRAARLVIAVVAIAFAVGLGLTMKRRTTPHAEPPVPRTDPTALVESEGGSTIRITGSHQDARIEYKRLLSYASGASKMVGVTITSERSGKTFVITGGEGQAGANESSVDLTGGVRMQASDGLTLSADRASYSKADNIVHVPGDVVFSRGRTSGSGVGMDYDQNQDIVTIADRASITVAPDGDGAGGMTLAAGTLEFRRTEKIMRLDRHATITRDRQTIDAEQATAHLSEDEQHVELLELRQNSRITTAAGGPGGLEALTGRDVDLRYASDGQTLQRAVINGTAQVRLAGDRGQAGRQIAANGIDIGVGPDGATPTSLIARDNVTVTLPGEQGAATRIVTSQTLDGVGDQKRGLTGAHFTGNVQFAEKGPGVDRAARSAVLDTVMAPGFGAIDDATFTRGVRFADGAMFATAAAARYAIARGVVELTGSEPGSIAPHVINEQIAVDATRIEITLDGPLMKATGTVKSVLQPKKGADAKAAHVPSMLKQDQPVNVTADDLAYNGPASRAVYTGHALLWQGETSVKGASITIDDTTGDLSATGPVTTATILKQDDGKGSTEKVNSVGTAVKDFVYTDAEHRATYTGDAHLTGPQGDLTSPKIELFLKPSGDEVERAEGYDGVTLRGEGRKTVGTRLTYFGDDERYLVTGTPVTITDACGRETTGRTLTFFRATDRIVVDGNEQIRTQTKSNSKSTCP